MTRIESDDFENWRNVETVLEGETYDLQPYAMPAFYYGGVYLGLVAIHEQSSDRVWTELTWSPDTRKWYRIDAGKPLIPPSEKKLDYDYGCVYACAYPVIKKDKIQLYYGASDWLHYGWRNGSLCLATLRPDGFAGYIQEKSNQKGVVLTKTMNYNGGAIKLTAGIERGGAVDIAILNGDGLQIAHAKPIKKTMTNGMLEFDDEIGERIIRLEIRIKNAKVYSFSIN